MCSAALPQPSRAVLRSCAIWDSEAERSEEGGGRGFVEEEEDGESALALVGCWVRVGSWVVLGLVLGFGFKFRVERTSCRRSGLLRRQASRISSRGEAP